MASNAAVQYKERAAKAYAAMESIGVQRQTVTPHLRRLLKSYDNVWDFIEAENYRVLIDAYFEEVDTETKSREDAARANRAHAEDVPDGEPPSPELDLLETHDIPPAIGQSSHAAVQEARPRPSNSPIPHGEGSSGRQVSPSARQVSPSARQVSPSARQVSSSGRPPVSNSGTYNAVDPQSLARALDACTQTVLQDSDPKPQASLPYATTERIDEGASSTAAAAREREKGKSPLVEDNREKGKAPLIEENSCGGVAFRSLPPPPPPSQDYDTPPPKHVSVKVEVTSCAPLSETHDTARAPNESDLGPELLVSAAFHNSDDPAESEPFIPVEPSGDIVLSPIPLQEHDPCLNLTTYVRAERGIQPFPFPLPPFPYHPTEGWVADAEAPVQHASSSSAIPQSDSPPVGPPDESMGAANQLQGRNSERAANRRENAIDGLKQGVVSDPTRHCPPEPYLAGEKGFILITPRPTDKRSAGGNRDLDLHTEDSPGSGTHSIDLRGDSIRPSFILSGPSRREMGRMQQDSPSPTGLTRRQKQLNTVKRDGQALPCEDGAGSSQPESRAVKRKTHGADSRGSDSGANSAPRSNGNGTNPMRPTLRSSHNVEPAGGSGSSSRRQRLHNADLTPVKMEMADLVDLTERRPKHNPADLSRGTEKLPIPCVNEFTSETISDKFNYIASNVVYQMAYINISLARIGDEDCCAECTGNCFDAPHPCPCSRETGGEYAYTPDGRLKASYIEHELMRKQDVDEMMRKQDVDEKKKYVTFCSVDCPLERVKNDVFPEKCKGHQLRKFVKECWHKCGCSVNCGNRVVQRGIVRRLEVFFTNTGKGWGIRAAEYLPAGTFVCEYVGEIVTNMELDQRNHESRYHGHDEGSNHKDTYPMLLDGDWCSERGLKDEEALCLDATKYGNVARFINHRCMDANLIDIPVSIEAQDRHYYHVAFFTSRDVQPGEELTWDYTIDFEDDAHPIPAFRCLCNSDFCRWNGSGTRSKKHKR